MMKTEKMTYEKPTVQKVEFDFKTRIADSTCDNLVGYEAVAPSKCKN